MEHKTHTSFSLFKALICAAITIGAVTVAHAQSTAVDPSGTWFWTNPSRNGAPGSTNTLTLKYANGTLTGTVKSPSRGGNFNTSDIANGKLEGAKLTFDVSRTYGTNKFVSEFSGSVSTDTIIGNISSTGRNGSKRSRHWVAKRASATVQ